MPELEPQAVKTYRYLRLAMITLMFMLAAAVVIEWSKTSPHCWQTSISAYYYTPARAIFVGTLIAVGVCMVALKSNREREDLLLNVGGMLAPVVALVPTPGQGSCRSVPMTLQQETPENIANNMETLFFTGGAAIVIALILLARATERKPIHLLGIAIALLALGIGITWFAANRDGFIQGAHYTAAAVLFVCIVAVVVLNAWPYGRGPAAANRKPFFTKVYAGIAIAMLATVALLLPAKWIFDWEHAILFIEFALILLFAGFWVTQTAELWEEGLRKESPGE